MRSALQGLRHRDTMYKAPTMCLTWVNELVMELSQHVAFESRRQYFLEIVSMLSAWGNICTQEIQRRGKAGIFIIQKIPLLRTTILFRTTDENQKDMEI